MSTPWMFVTGVAIVCYLLPELIVAFSMRISRIPTLFNICSATAGALIAASFVY